MKQVKNKKRVKDFNTIEKIMRQKHDKHNPLRMSKIGNNSNNYNNESMNMNNNLNETNNLEQSNLKSQNIRSRLYGSRAGNCCCRRQREF